MPRLLALAIFTLALLPASAAAAPPAPFGHACAPKDGVRFCPTTGLADRVASFDGVPLDVDVTLPPSGDRCACAGASSVPRASRSAVAAAVA
jgi:hypothetical protein